MLRAAEGFAMNFGFFARAAVRTSRKPIVEQLGRRRHRREDPRGLRRHARHHRRLPEGRRRVRLPGPAHADTINESRLAYESTMPAIGGRTIHMYHTEGAGGGHAAGHHPLQRRVQLPALVDQSDQSLHASNTLDEHLDMAMMRAQPRRGIAEDVAFAESRVRRRPWRPRTCCTISAPISMMGSDSQGMGRMQRGDLRAPGSSPARCGPARSSARRERRSAPTTSG